MPQESDETWGIGPEADDTDEPSPAPRRAPRRRLVLRGGRPVEVTTGPERETR